MIDWLTAKWRSYQFKLALKQGNFKKAQALIQKINKLNKKLSWLEKLYQQQLEIEKSLAFYQKQVSSLNQSSQKSLEAKLKPNLELIDYIYSSFQLKQKDLSLLQCTGIESQVFTELEIALVDFIEAEINKISTTTRSQQLKKALEDLDGLKKGIDPQYNHRLSSHVYLLKYFLDNIYSNYLAWFFVYQQQLLPKNIQILDLAAGPGTVLYGLALFLSSKQQFFANEKIHITYYSLEQQADLQYRGLQFWRKYIEALATPINAYFRFNTVNIFDYHNYFDKLPDRFFDFIVISHCFFYELESRNHSYQIYRQIFERCLVVNGYVLLIIQGKKLFKIYEMSLSENIEQESHLIKKFLTDLDLKLEWYQYLTSTGQRNSLKQNFNQFARENLPIQNYLTDLKQKYFQQTYPSNYVIDDYLILAKKS